MPISSNDLTYMRACINELLPDSCNLLTVTQTPDGQGGFTEAWGTATASVSCRIDYTEGDETVFGNALNPYTGWIVTLPHNTTITPQYRIEISSTQYNVTEVDDGKSWQASIRVAVEKT